MVTGIFKRCFYYK